MVMKLNKTEFIKELENKLYYSEEKCIMINEVLENNFFLSQKNKDKIIKELIIKLNCDEFEATKIYDIAVKIIQDEIKYKLNHPFKSKP